MVPAVAGNVSQSPKCYQGTFPPLPVTFHVVPGYALRESERERERERCVCVLCARTFASVLWARSSHCRSFRARLRPCPQRLSLGQECCGLWCDGLCARLLRPLDSSSFAGPRGVPPLGFFEGFGCESWPPCLPGPLPLAVAIIRQMLPRRPHPLLWSLLRVFRLGVFRVWGFST